MIDQIIGFIIWGLLTIVFFVSIIFIEISNFIESFEKIPERVCAIKSDSIIRLGEHKFKIPSTLRGAYISGNGHSLSNIKRRHQPYTKICPTGPNSEFVRKQLLLHAPVRSELTDTHLPFSADIAVSFGKGNRPLTDLYEGRKISKNMDWEPSGDYRTRIRTFTGIAGGGGWSVRLFVTNDENFVTPRGNLVAFQCSMGGKKNHSVKGCSTWFAWSDDLTVTYSFNEQDYSIEEWRALHEHVINYIKSIKQDVDPKLRNNTNPQ
jgi:hypothetical protein